MNLGEITQQVNWRMGGRETDARIVAAIQANVNAEYATIWSEVGGDWKKTRTSLSYQANALSATLPADCEHVRIVARDQTGTLPLDHQAVDIEAYLNGHPQNAQPGTPYRWDAEGTELFLFPRPSAALTVYVWYTKLYTPLTLTTDVPAFPVNYHSILVEGAVMRMGASDSYDQAAVQAAIYNHKRLWRTMLCHVATAKPDAMHVPALPRPI